MELLTESQYNKLSLEEKIEYEEVEVENTLASVNIHVLLSKETLSQCWQVLYDSLNHKIPGLNAVVFLSLKRMGRGVNMHSVSQEDFKALIDFALDNNINVGFDSCGCNKFLKAIESRKNYEQLKMVSESCESSLFSFYVNVNGRGFPCSFNEIGEGIDLIKCDNFVSDIWNHPKTVAFRKQLLAKSRNCPTYKI